MSGFETKRYEDAVEDTVQCFIYTSVAKSFDSLEQMCDHINCDIKELSKEYLWHRDEFKLHCPLIIENDDKPTHLASAVCFGDNIEDEWFLVYLLLKITEKYKDMVVQVYDNDGDFLLIEAADHLPDWANPNSTENRVFIYKAAIHLIPPNLANDDMTLQEAVDIVTKMSEQTKASIEIQQAILSRIEDYPHKIKDSLHHAIVKLPVDIATLLSLNPTLISPIVRMYCNHDMIDAKYCTELKYDNCIISKVKFSKCLYAMLVHSKLIKNGSCLSMVANDKKTTLGRKLTCGYQMIMRQISKDLYSTKEFNVFKKSLLDYGYFKDNIKGSKGYTDLLNKAKEYFLSVECQINSCVGNSISEMMNTTEFSKLKQILLEQTGMIYEEDSDDWLTIHPDQLNDMLQTRYGKQVKFQHNDDLTSEISNFLKKTSDFEGIESGQADVDDKNIDFESDDFVNSLQKMLKIISTGKYEQEHASTCSDDMDYADGDNLNDLQDQELETKLHRNENTMNNSKTIMKNIIQSIKEEGLTGPSSNLLRTIGINKSDILDSDDDE